MSTYTHEAVTTLPTKTILTVMGYHLDGSSIHYGIDVPHFYYDGVHTVGDEFDYYLFMNIGKNWDEEYNGEFHNTFHNEEGALRLRVIDSSIA